MGNLMMSASLGLDAFEASPVELYSEATESDLQTVITAAYKQVLGNEYVMESQRLESAESLLRDGSITVRDFVRAIAQSSLYQSLFFTDSSQYRFIELNFKHLLGRAPQSQAEISEHVRIYHEEGYVAEINSYLDSEEYVNSFGEATVPYPRAIRSQVGSTTNDFNRMFTLLRGSATSDGGSGAKLITSVAADTATSIEPLKMGKGVVASSTSKRFRIVFASGGANAQLNHVANQEYVVSYKQLSDNIRKIQRFGGTIVKISEV